MRIVCAISSRNNEILRIQQSLNAMGHTVEMFYMDTYRAMCSYWEKKWNKAGFRQGESRYNQQKKEEFRRLVVRHRPDCILFVDFETRFFTTEELAEYHKTSRIAFWFVDEVAGHTEIEAYLRPYKVFVYEKDDVDYLAGHYGIQAVYCPVGYNDAYTQDVGNPAKSIDISFVGSPFKRRLALLETLAEKAQEKGWHLQVYGPFYESKHFWKKYLLARKYPHLMRYVQNRSVLPEEAAEIYAQSKICLNIHGSANRSLNPRTFEIMATGSLELLDAHEDYAGLVRPGQDVAVFADAEDLLQQSAYYLTHEEEREQIARQGKQCVQEVRSMRASLQMILSAAARPAKSQQGGKSS